MVQLGRQIIPFALLAICRVSTYENCDVTQRFRLADGHCNNLEHPEWGKADRIQNRMLQNAYEDGISIPRGGLDDSSLPSPRKISTMLHKAGDALELQEDHTLFVMLWGQFFAHDVILTPFSKGKIGKGLDCCGKNPEKNYCFPIRIPDDDEYFTSRECMDFTRSVSVENDEGVREQINKQTSYIDASMIYGANKEEQDELREMVDGKLKTVNNRLPADENDETCDLVKERDDLHYYCPKAGDERVNEQPGLTSLHSLFVREHNFLVTELKKQNPHWDDERLYQEGRKIVAAEVQYITYNEFLPEVLGEKYVRNTWLHLEEKGFSDTYDSSVDATIFNSFAVAILRFGHSLIHRDVGKVDNHYLNRVTVPLESTFFKPDFYHQDGDEGLEKILRWVSDTACPLSDRKMENSVTQHLFPDKNNKTTDLAARNIQRGRDHGIPGYNAYRQLCELPKATHFHTTSGGLIDHEASVAEKLSKVYESPDGIDLFTGALTEKRIAGSLVGPTQRCLMTKQFKNLKNGDRFFFERPYNTTGFKLDQLEQIRGRYLSSILCQNTNSNEMQKNVFRQAKKGNARVDCEKLKEIDLQAWKE